MGRPTFSPCPSSLSLLLLAATVLFSCDHPLAAFSRSPVREPAWVSEDFPRANKAAMKDALASVGIVDNKKQGPHRFAEVGEVGGGKALGIKGVGGADSCYKLVGKDCDACPSPERNWAGYEGCDTITSQCQNSFCDPLCLDTIPYCKVEGVEDKDGMQFSQANSPATSRALCAVLKAHLCSKEKCCMKDKMLQKWTEEFTLSDVENPPLSIEACMHDENDKGRASTLCRECKKAMEGKIMAKPYAIDKACGGLESFSPVYGDNPRSGMPQKEESFYSKTTPKAPVKDELGSRMRQGRTNYEFGFPGVGAHKALVERCERLHEKLEVDLPKFAKEFAAENACHCMGCCDAVEKCHFPIEESEAAQAKAPPEDKDDPNFSVGGKNTDQ